MFWAGTIVRPIFRLGLPVDSKSSAIWTDFYEDFRSGGADWRPGDDHPLLREHRTTASASPSERTPSLWNRRFGSLDPDPFWQNAGFSLKELKSLFQGFSSRAKRRNAAQGKLKELKNQRDRIKLLEKLLKE